MDYRPLGTTDIKISAVALGCWPISGMTSLHVNDADSLATVQACFDVGVNFLDTAYAYGRNGESERLIARAIRGRRDELVIATKVGIAWDEAGKQVRDAAPATIRRQFETSLKRLETERVELLYLHAPDPTLPIAESAGALREILDRGQACAIGASNCTVEQLAEFSQVCPLSAVQPHYNMLQREIERDLLPWRRERSISVVVYWPLLKGLLAGKLARDHVFQPGDGRAKYAMFQGSEWHKNQDLIDRLRPIAAQAGVTVAQLVINWTINQPGITSALCGAKRPAQIIDNAGGAGWKLTEDQMAAIDAALAERGTPVSQAAVS